MSEFENEHADQADELAAEAGKTSGQSADSLSPPGEDSADTMDEVLDPLEALQQESDQFKNRWLRSEAEFDNYRKRMQRDLQDARRLSQADLIRQLLEVLDNFERAMDSLQVNVENAADLESMQAGVALIYQNLKNILGDRGLEKIEALNMEFDPRFHEAIQQVEVEGAEPGQIVEVVQSGYIFQDQVLRPSRVVVAK